KNFPGSYPNETPQKVNPDVKSKVVVRVSNSKETHVKRKRIVSKEDDRKKKLKGKSKKEDSNSEFETDVVDSSSDEIGRKRKKLNIKAGLKRKRSGLDSSDSSSTDTAKINKEESDEESIPKKGKKKEKHLMPEQATREEYLLTFPSFHARTTPSLFSAIKNLRVKILRFLTDIGFSSLHDVSIDQLLSKLGWFVVSKFKSYMLSLDTGDKIELLYLDSTKFDRFPIVRTCPAIKNWSTYLMKQRQESELKHRVLGYLDLHVEWTEAEVQDNEGFIGSLEISKKEVCGYTAFKHKAHQV
nr:ELM2 domain-containing protein [Tanacetum cinerariifolium]